MGSCDVDGVDNTENVEQRHLYSRHIWGDDNTVDVSI